MKKLILLACCVSLYGACAVTNKVISKYEFTGILTSLNINNNEEYSFSTNNDHLYNVESEKIVIERSSNIIKPILLRKQIFKNNAWVNDIDGYQIYKFVLPINYEIEAF